MDSHLVKLSKFLNLILRHKPQIIGLSLDYQGWTHIDELIDLVNQHGIPLSRDLLETVVATNDQQRFAFNGDRSKIRANHSSESGRRVHVPRKFRFFCVRKWLLAYRYGAAQVNSVSKYDKRAIKRCPNLMENQNVFR